MITPSPAQILSLLNAGRQLASLECLYNDSQDARRWLTNIGTVPSEEDAYNALGNLLNNRDAIVATAKRLESDLIEAGVTEESVYRRRATSYLEESQADIAILRPIADAMHTSRGDILFGLPCDMACLAQCRDKFWAWACDKADAAIL
jgi:hypothetical protein